ncbi:TetR/AcrR family transcriptional regulator [Thiohalorhabdus sp. Cl-TMA]|uniref:TetR/AcrR family transcriptional regulator n=1 Tax=Thiohalorhabdus methylotrophus TaxID=3242694 RepID=A0ABV4TX79_9GAMM
MGRPSTAREDLVTTAANELWQGSYGSVSVGSLCSSAEVKRGSFYYFFDSKDDLVLAALEHSWKRMQGRFERILGDETIPPLQRLSHFFHALADVHEQYRRESGHVPGCPFGNLSVELGSIHDPIRERVSDIFGRIVGYLAELLHAARDAGELEANSSEIERRSEQIFVCLQGAQVLAKTHSDPEVIRRMAPVAVAIATGF